MGRKSKSDMLTVRGFIRGQIVDSKTKKICGDSGWVENKLMNTGLTALADLIGAGANSFVVGYMICATQTDAPNMTQTAVLGSTHSFKAITTGTSGTCTQTFTASFGSASLAASCEVGGVGLCATNSAGSLFAMQTFATSQWNTNQDFNVTYQVRFATA